MKIKLVILSALLVGVVSTASAQTKEKYYSESMKDNWFISIGGGAQVITLKSNIDHGFSDAISPKAAISLGRWINPVWAFRGQLAGWESKIWTDNYRPVGDYWKASKHTLKIHGDAIFNLSNFLAGYNPDRVFSLSTFAGPGLTFAKSVVNKNSGDLNTLINGSVGAIAAFNLGSCWDLNLEVRGELQPSVFKDQAAIFTSGTWGAMLGLTYTIGGKKFVPVGMKVDNSALNAEINRYKEALAASEAELAKAKAALANQKPQIVEVVKEVVVGTSAPRGVFFPLNKTVIDDYGMLNIKMIADAMKSNPGKKYKVAGYADKATGSAGWNQVLSEKRAQAVRDALIKFGVSPSQIEISSHGGTDMFDKNILNRVVILE